MAQVGNGTAASPEVLFPHAPSPPVLPCIRVEKDLEWRDADAVKNPHRGPTASARGQTFTTDVVAEGLQRLSLGQSYSAVGEWSVGFRPARRQDPAKVRARIDVANKLGKKARP